LKKLYLLKKFTSIFLFVHYLRNKSKKGSDKPGKIWN